MTQELPAVAAASRTACVTLVRLLALGALTLALGCATEPRPDTGAAPPAAASIEDTSVPATAPAPATDAFADTSDPVEQKRPTLDPAVLAQVRAAAQPDFDRLVFEFGSERVPGYRVAYEDGPVRDCGSGDLTNVQGSAVLAVRLEPAQAHTEEGKVTVVHERQFTLPVVRELELSCDFEGHVSWAVGLASRRPFRVSELATPARLVVDIQH